MMQDPRLFAFHNQLSNPISFSSASPIMSSRNTNSIKSPTENVLIVDSPQGNDDDGKVKMKQQLGLLEGVAIILGIIFGSGTILLQCHTTTIFIFGTINGNYTLSM